MNSRLLPEAEEELEQAVAHYEAEEAGLGLRFAAAFERTVDRLLADPTSWPIASAEFRRCRVFNHPYDVILVAEKSEVVIAAVAHHHRRTGYWRRRLPDTP